jgi:hypothetical protein
MMAVTMTTTPAIMPMRPIHFSATHHEAPSA